MNTIDKMIEGYINEYVNNNCHESQEGVELEINTESFDIFVTFDVDVEVEESINDTYGGYEDVTYEYDYSVYLQEVSVFDKEGEEVSLELNTQKIMSEL